MDFVQVAGPELNCGSLIAVKIEPRSWIFLCLSFEIKRNAAGVGDTPDERIKAR